MTFQPCRPATIKLLPYEGAPYVTAPLRIIFYQRRQFREPIRRYLQSQRETVN